MKDNKKPREVAEYPSEIGFKEIVGLYCTDPLGSYTGRPLNRDEVPVQDADDL